MPTNGPPPRHDKPLPSPPPPPPRKPEANPESDAVWDAVFAYGLKHGKAELFKELACMLIGYAQAVGSTRSTFESGRWEVVIWERPETPDA